MKGVIRIGDKTTSGGSVLEASSAGLSGGGLCGQGMGPVAGGGAIALDASGASFAASTGGQSAHCAWRRGRGVRIAQWQQRTMRSVVLAGALGAT